jgi:hypothetical protein
MSKMSNLNDVVSENPAHGRIFFLLMLSLQPNHRSISAEYVMSLHDHAPDILWLVEGFYFWLPRMYMIVICIWRERESVRNCLGKSSESLFSRFDPFCFFGYPVLSASVRIPCYLQHFEAGNCHFNGICNILEFEQQIFHDICNILVLQVFMLLVFLQLEFI